MSKKCLISCRKAPKLPPNRRWSGRREIQFFAVFDHHLDEVFGVPESFQNWSGFS